MEQLERLIGLECGIDEISRKLYEIARSHQTPVVGAMHLTCADEAEIECVEAFQHGFTDHLLPKLKVGERSSFRLSNLGARYEWGAAGVADDHYSTRAASEAFKLMVIKINSHVSADRTAEGLRFGTMRRYEIESTFCGALHHLLGGGKLPFAEDLRESFSSEGLDRIAALNDPEQVPADARSGFAAVVNARLQARRVACDIRDRRPRTPTLYLIAACVTLNRIEKDTEVLCGIYRIDWRGDKVQAEYSGVGDDPRAYRLIRDEHPIRLTDDQVGVWRPARDHRRLVIEHWLRRQGAEPGADGEPVDLIPPLDELRASGIGNENEPREALKSLLAHFARQDPVPAALFMFSRKLAGPHHLFRAHRLARGLAGDVAAREILGELHDEVDHISEEQAAKALRRFEG